MTTMSGLLGEIIPALMAAGLTEAQIREVSDNTRRLMGDGGTIREWLTAMSVVIADLDNPLAERAFLLALDEAAATK